MRVLAGGVEAALHTGGAQTADRGRLEKELREVESRIEQLEGKLANPRFVDGAPAEVVEKTRRMLAELQDKRDTLRRLLDGG